MFKKVLPGMGAKKNAALRFSILQCLNIEPCVCCCYHCVVVFVCCVCCVFIVVDCCALSSLAGFFMSCYSCSYS